jgi:uncharacterized membrane protein YphA (DoxX/SURF4 family)
MLWYSLIIRMKKERLIMKAVIAMLLILGIFTSYGAFTLMKNQEFGAPTGTRGGAAGATVSAQQDPEGFRTTLYIVGGFAVLCFAGAGFLMLRERKQNSDGEVSGI